MDVDSWGVVAAVASAIAAVAAAVVAFISLKLQNSIHRESGRMLSVSGYPISWAEEGSPISRAAINVQLRNPGRMETKVDSVVLSFPAYHGRGSIFYSHVWPEQLILAGNGANLTTPFYVCKPELAECRVQITMGDGQQLTQSIPCYEPSQEANEWPVVER